MDSISDNGSLRIILQDSQKIPVNHRDWKSLIEKYPVTQERTMTESSILEELQKDTQNDPEKIQNQLFSLLIS